MTSFVPTANVLRALAPTTLVVRGLRGSGKTAMIERLTALPPSAAWGQLASGAPASGAVRFVAATPLVAPPDDAPGQRMAWLDGVVRDVAAALPELPPPPESASRRDRVGAILTWLDLAHAALIARGEALVLLYDDPEGPIGALLSLWLVLSARYRRLRARVLARPERLATAQLPKDEQHKIHTRTVDLAWSVEDLFRVAARGGQPAGLALESIDDPIFGEVPACPDEATCARIAAVAGLYLGGSITEWVHESLRGRRGQLSPRSFLRVLAGGPDPARARAAVGAEALDALARDLPAAAIPTLRGLTLPADATYLAEILGSDALALLRAEAILVPAGEALDLAPLYRAPAPR